MRHDPEALMVFAAGFGTRMAPLTDQLPKPLLRVGGRTLLDHALACRDGLSIKRSVVNAHYKSDMIEQAMAESGVHVTIEHPDILDTGGGLKAALPRLAAQSVYTMNSDVIWLGPNPLKVLKNAWAAADCDALVLLVPFKATHMRKAPGDFSMSPSGDVTRKGDLVYTGAQILKTERVFKVTENVFSLNVIWDALIRAGGLKGVIYPGEWCDVGTPAGLARAETLWAERNSD